MNYGSMEGTEGNLQQSSDCNPTDHGAGNPVVGVRELRSEFVVESAVKNEEIPVSDKLVGSEGLPVMEDAVAASEVVSSDSNLVVCSAGAGKLQDDKQQLNVDLGLRGLTGCERIAAFDLNNDLKKDNECGNGCHENVGGLEPECCVVSNMVVAESGKVSGGGASGDSRRSSMESLCHESPVPRTELGTTANVSGQPLDERLMDVDSKGVESSGQCERNAPFDLNDSLQKEDECGVENLVAQVEVLDPESGSSDVSTLAVAGGVQESRKLSDGGYGDSHRSSMESLWPESPVIQPEARASGLHSNNIDTASIVQPHDEQAMKSLSHESLVTQIEVRASHSEGLCSATVGTASAGQPHDEQPVDEDSRGAENSPHCERNAPLDLNDALKKDDERGDGRNENLRVQDQILEPECHDVSTMVVEQRVPESRKLSGGASDDSQRSSMESPCHESHGTQPEAGASQSESLHSYTIATSSNDQPHDEQTMALDTGRAKNSPHYQPNALLYMDDTLQKGDECDDVYNEILRAQVQVLQPKSHDVSTMVVAEGVQESKKLSDGASGDSQRSSLESPSHESHVTQQLRTSHSEGQPQDHPIGSDSEGIRSSPHRNKTFPIDANDSSKNHDQSKDDYYDSLGAPIHVSGTGKEIPLPRVPQHFMGMKDGDPCRLPIGNHLEEAIDDLPPGVHRGPRGYLRGVWDYARKAAHQARVNSLEASSSQNRVRELESRVQYLNQLMQYWRHTALHVMERSSCSGSSFAPILVLPVTETGLPNDEDPSTSTGGAPSTSTATGFTPSTNPLVEDVRATPLSGPALSMGLLPTGQLLPLRLDRCFFNASAMAMRNRAHPSSVQHLSTSTDAIKTSTTLSPSGRASGSNADNVEQPRHARRVRFEGLDVNDDGGSEDGNVMAFHVPKKKRTR